MRQIHQLLNNIGMLFLAKGFNIFYSIATISLIARYLSIDYFGKYSFAVNFILMCTPIVQFGLSQILIRHIVQEKEKASADIATVGSIKIFIMFFYIILIVLITNLFRIADEVKIAIYLCMISEFLLTFVGLSTDVFVAYERMKYVPVLININRFLILSGIFSVIYFDWGFYSLFIVQIVINALSTLIGFYIMVTRFIKPKFSFSIIQIKYLLKEAYPIAIGIFLMELSLRMDTFFLTALTDFNQVAFFGVPLKIVSGLLIISVAITDAVLPIFSRLAQYSMMDLLSIMEKTLRYLMVLLLPICIYITLFAKEIILFIFGDKFIPSIPSLQFFIWVLLFYSLIILFGNFLISMRQQKLVIIPILIGICINVIFDMVLIPHYGHVGASLGKCIAFGITASTLCYFIIRRVGILHISEIAFKPLINAGFLFIVIYLLKNISFVFSIVGGLFCYGLSVYLSQIFSFGELVQLKQIIERAKSGKVDF